MKVKDLRRDYAYVVTDRNGDDHIMVYMGLRVPDGESKSNNPAMYAAGLSVGTCSLRRRTWRTASGCQRSTCIRRSRSTRRSTRGTAFASAALDAS